MRYCHTCGMANDINRRICCHCNVDMLSPPSARGRIPACVPVAGYISLDQLHDLASDIPDAKPAAPSPPTDWFSVSMKSVKWTGVILTCLVAIFFLAMVVKAFM